jgi:hypothetical protein
VDCPAVGKPLGDEPVIFGLALRSLIGSAVEVPPIKCDETLAAGLVEAVGRNRLEVSGHMRSLLDRRRREIR